MKRRGMIRADSGDLKVEVQRDGNGLITHGLVIDDNNYDCVNALMTANKGEIKEFPVLGLGERYLKSVGRASEITAEVQTQLELDGYKADVSIDAVGKLIIDVE